MSYGCLTPHPESVASCRNDTELYLIILVRLQEPRENNGYWCNPTPREACSVSGSVRVISEPQRLTPSVRRAHWPRSNSDILSSCVHKFHKPVINSFQVFLFFFFLKLSGVWCKNIGVWAEQRNQHLQLSKMVPIFSDLGGRSRDTLCQLYWLLLRLVPQQHWLRWQRTYPGSYLRLCLHNCNCNIGSKSKVRFIFPFGGVHFLWERFFISEFPRGPVRMKEFLTETKGRLFPNTAVSIFCGHLVDE